MRGVIRALAAATVFAGTVAINLPSGAAAAPKPVYYDATSYQVDGAHTGVAPGSPLPTTMKLRWRHALGDNNSYPLIAQNRLYIISSESFRDPSTVWAFDLASGRTLWKRLIGGNRAGTGLTFDGGHLYAVNSHGVLYSLNPSSGAVEWDVELTMGLKLVPVPQDPGFISPLVAHGGTIYAMDNDNELFYAVDGRTGKAKWAKYNVGQPMVNASGIYAVQGCFQSKYDVKGKQLWKVQSAGCNVSSYAGLAAVTSSQIWVQYGSLGQHIVSAKNGSEIGNYTSASFPVVAAKVAVLADDNPTTLQLTLRAVSAGTGKTLWTRKPSPSTYGDLTGGPIATSTVVYMRARGGTVFGFDLATGREVWRGDAGVPLETTGTNGGVFPSMNIGDGALGVTTNHYIALFS